MTELSKLATDTSFTVYGKCNGYFRSTSYGAVSATFEGVAGFSETSTEVLSFTDCAPSPIWATGTTYFDSNFVPLGASISGGKYFVYQAPPVIPVSVKVGDTGTIGTQTVYSDSTKSAIVGQEVMTYLIEPDTIYSSMVDLINESYDSNGALLSTSHNRHRLLASGDLIPYSADIKSASLHLVMVANDSSKPYVIQAFPGAIAYPAMGSPLNTQITATFSESINPASINVNSITLKTSAGVAVNGVVTLDSNGKTLRFTPSVLLSADTDYAFSISSDVRDFAGNRMGGVFNSAFRTDPGWFLSYSKFVVEPQSFVVDSNAVAIGDVNGDGRNDVIEAISTGAGRSLLVMVQDANGLLATPISYPINISAGYVSSIAIGDLNNDGRQDVAIGDSGGLVLFTQNIQGTLDVGATYPVVGDNIRIADLNNDGKKDVVMVTGSFLNSSVVGLLQNASGTLDAPVVYATGGLRMEVGDVNNDGLIDIVVAAPNVPQPRDRIEVLIQKAGGFNAPVKYSPIGGYEPSRVAIGDINGDGLNDIVMTYGFTTLGVLYQNAAGTLDAIVEHAHYDQTPAFLNVVDVTGDGRKDVVMTYNVQNFRLGAYQQMPDGSLSLEKYFEAPPNLDYSQKSFAIGDINSDGKPDAVYNGISVMYHN